MNRKCLNDDLGRTTKGEDKAQKWFDRCTAARPLLPAKMALTITSKWPHSAFQRGLQSLGYMVKTVLIGVLLSRWLSAFAAEPCARASTNLTPSQRKMYARSISSNLTKWQPPTQIKVQKALTVANWTAVWAKPNGMEQGVFFYSQEKSGLVYHDVWGGYAALSEKADVVRWVMKLAPSVPNDLPQCFADAVTAGH